jgi:hypothetical protein
MSKVQITITGDAGDDKTIITRLIENMLHQEGVIYAFSDNDETERKRTLHRDTLCDTQLGEIAALNIEVKLSEHAATLKPEK